MYDQLEGKGKPSFFGAHLPVVVTWNRRRPFPFNTGNKGVGPVPVEARLEEYSALYEETIDRCEATEWNETLALRLGAVRRFIDGDDVSSEALTSLEIFEKTTFHNLCDFPIATLHYTGGGPVYRSFQIDTVVRILTPEDAYYRFAFLSRRLLRVRLLPHHPDEVPLRLPFLSRRNSRQDPADTDHPLTRWAGRPPLPGTIDEPLPTLPGSRLALLAVQVLPDVPRLSRRLTH